MKKHLLYIIVIILMLTGCTKNTDEILNRNDMKKSIGKLQEGNGENLITIVEEVFVSDTNDDNILGTEGDEVLNVEDGIAETGLVPEIYITDNNDNIVHSNEEVHIVVNLKNTSDITYSIQQLHIEGGDIFGENSWHNMKVEGGDEQGYILDSKETKLAPKKIGIFELMPGDNFTFEVDGAIDPDDINPEMYDSERMYCYIKYDFMAENNETEHVYYYSTDSQKLRIDLANI